MNLVSLERVSKRHADKVVLDGVTLGIDGRDRVGVIGVNGSGKSTLLRIIAGVEPADDGRVVRARGTRVHYLPQQPQLDPRRSALQAVLAAPTPAAATTRAFERATTAVRARPADARAHERLEAATRAMDAAGGWQLDSRARALLDRLGIADVEQPVGDRSGGQRKRIALARALLEPGAGESGTLLILDEPTNHLDVDAVEWLEDELAAWAGAMLLVTHDRYLLDRVAGRVVEVNAGAVHSHPGSYADYLAARARREEQAEAAERRRDSRARRELAWLRRGAQARTTKARYRVEQAEALLADRPGPPPADLTVDLPARRIGSKVVNLHNAGKSFDGRRVLGGVDLKLAPDARIGVVGPNGSGKTTLLRMLAGQLAPDHGSVRVGDTVHAAYYGQEPQPLPPDRLVLDAVREVVLETRLASGARVTAGQLLERFAFDPGAQKAYVCELSGGERRRLELLRTLAGAPNLLLLDEPTNDLDLDTLAVLEDYLDDWPGALVVASHDRYFLDRVCADILSIEPDGGVRHHPGGWSAYRGHRAEREAGQRRGRSRAGADAAQRRSERDRDSADGGRKLRFHERRELQQLERRLPELEARKAELAEALQAAGGDYRAAGAAAAALAVLVDELEAAEGRWLELAAIAEGA